MNPEVFEANPKVSIIISAYNVEKYLRQCLDSAINQTLKDIEIICVNDGSTDTSLEILKEYVRKDNRINLIDQKNEGAGAARNTGLDAANGKYVHFLDGDDWLERDAMEILHDKAVSDDLDILKFDRFTYNDTTGGSSRLEYFDGKQLPNVFSSKSIPFIFNIASSTAWNKLYRHSFLKEKNIRFQNLKTCNDIYFAFAAIALADRVSIINKPLISWRVNHANSTTSNRGVHWECIFFAYEKLREDLKYIFDKNPDLEGSFQNKFFNHFCYEFYYSTEKDKYFKMAKQLLPENSFLVFNASIAKNATILQELEILENFMRESSEEEIKNSANYIHLRIRLNFARMRNTNAGVLSFRYFAVYNRIEKYL